MVAEAGPAARTVGRDAVVLVDEPSVPERLKDPPAAFDVVVGIGHVGMFEVAPVGNAFAQAGPFIHVSEHAVLAPGVKRGDAIGLDFLLVLEPQFFFDLEFDRQAMGVPARFARHAVALHRLVAGDKVLEDAGDDVMDAGLPVRRGRAFEEDEETVVRQPGARRLLHAALEDSLLLPEREDVFFELREAHLRFDWLKHGRLLRAAPGDENARPRNQGRACEARGTTLLPTLRRALSGRRSTRAPLTVGNRPGLVGRRRLPTVQPPLTPSARE